MIANFQQNVQSIYGSVDSSKTRAREGGASVFSTDASLFSKISRRPESEGAAEGGCGGNSAAPERNQTEASPAALLVKARHHRKILFSLREKEIRRAQNEKSKEYFSVVWRLVASGGGAASLVPLKESSREVYNYSTKTDLFGIDCSARRVRRAPQGKIRFCFRRKIPEFAPITI